ncbi:hypothetical protein RRG08_030261 [Elysia crispata]|uniref:Uncharacterized protein n=1 Tax=Elysia crispata TaxID=231223 RepID=A0AAE1AKW9_9GAST|nr:hypothetical protein RRG08_030261 [Elysia crispata]
MQRGREKGDAKTESKEEGRVVCFLAGGGTGGIPSFPIIVSTQVGCGIGHVMETIDIAELKVVEKEINALDKVELEDA